MQNPTADTSPSPEPSSRFVGYMRLAPRFLVLLLAIVAVEVIALAGAGVWALAEMFRPGSVLGADLFLAAFALGLAVLLVGSARALLRGRRWGRSPIMTWQLFQIVVGVTLVEGMPVVGVVLIGLAGGAIFSLMTPSVVAVTTERAETDPDDLER